MKRYFELAVSITLMSAIIMVMVPVLMFAILIAACQMAVQKMKGKV